MPQGLSYSMHSHLIMKKVCVGVWEEKPQEAIFLHFYSTH